MLLQTTLFHSFFLFFLATLCSLWDLSSLTRDWTQAWQWKHQVLTTGPPGNSPFHSFLWLSSIPLYVCMCVCVYTYHVFFIHSCVDSHLGCFHVLAIVSSAAVNIGVHVSFQIRVFSGYMPRSGIAGSYGNSVFSMSRSGIAGLYGNSICSFSFLKKFFKNASNFIFCPWRVAYGISVPWPGIEPTPSAVKVQVLTTGPPGNSPFLVF